MFETQKKRVVTLYRVSSKNQVTFNNNVGDIPLQQRECKQFIASKPEWELVDEYRELGVSGFKKKSNERDVLQQILLDAKKGKFDVILAFMFDRFGRRHDDTPFFIQELVKTGVEVWTVKEGQQTFNSHIDELMAFIRSWQSSGESGKTATRVTAAHKALVEDGMYRGGSAPFGYRLEIASELNKKGKPVLKMVIDPEEAEIVKWIYNLVDTLGYGQLRIACALNEKGVLSKTGTTWTAATVNYLLKNPMYKGIFTYGRRTNDAVFSKMANPELIIIDEAKWNRVQKTRAARNPHNTANVDVPCIRSTKGPLLLVGLIRCGHCGSPLTTMYNMRKYHTVDGTLKVSKNAKYRCSGKALKKAQCDGQKLFSKNIVEGLVEDEVKNYLDKLKKMDLGKEIDELRKKNTASEVTELKKLNKQLNTLEKEILGLEGEIIRVIQGVSSFDRDRLNRLILTKEAEKKNIMEQIAIVSEKLESKKVEFLELDALQQFIPVWSEVYENAPIEKKKMLLGSLVERVTVHRSGVEIQFKMSMNRFFANAGVSSDDGFLMNMGEKILTSESKVEKNPD